MVKSGHFLNRTIWVVSLVSLFTDMAGEMLYPILPLFFQQMGYSGIWAGVIESVADAVSGLSKPFFGKWSDHIQQRKPFIQVGYTLSALAKPAMVFFSSIPCLMLLRSVDRLGKGMRGGARDALLTDASPPEFRGRVFGFHRTMDTLGAFLGPLLALLFLNYFPNQYKSLFLWAIIPGLLAAGLTFKIKDVLPKNKPVSFSKGVSWFHFWKSSTKEFKGIIIGLTIIACVNSSDMFLLVRASNMPMMSTHTLYLYLWYNFVYTVFSYPLGQISDRMGIKPILLSGYLVMALVYAFMQFNLSNAALFGVFGLYGVYAAATEGLSKAWISQHCAIEHRAQSFGLLSGIQSVGVLVSGALYALMAWLGKMEWAFGITATVVVMGAFFLMLLPLRANVKIN